MKKITNLTPHPVMILAQDGGTITIPATAPAPRLKTFTTPEGLVNGIPLVRTRFGETTDLPPEEEGVLLIVSQLVKSGNPERNDLVVPADIVRDSAGAIQGCRALSF